MTFDENRSTNAACRNKDCSDMGQTISKHFTCLPLVRYRDWT
ncbi:hypothetical protein MANES_03G157500v8 [Manihot esculenta]|uniref:Uncharacterized protein n=1 Tax=Manihot esculenta TaxID=3983 RepID=A0A2C9W7U7_MANES|nr:hypothetical protein MANES_03G157500v8 [Manihot esculenta]